MPLSSLQHYKVSQPRRPQLENPLRVVMNVEFSNVKAFLAKLSTAQGQPCAL
jgi:hypothetical protein